MKKTSLLISFFSIIALTSCSDKESLFKGIGENFSAPIALAVDTAHNRAYVVNSNNAFAYTGASLSILDITDPASPSLLENTENPITIPNYSGQIYLDTAAIPMVAYIPNRESENDSVTIDHLLRVNLSESDAGFGTVDTYVGGDNPFGIACCDTSGRLYVANNGGTVSVYNTSDLSTFTQVSLQIRLSSGESFSGRASTEVAMNSTQAFVSNRAGRIYVINTAEVGDSTKNPIDYIILNGNDFRGIALSGSTLLAVDAGIDPGVVQILNTTSIPPVATDTATISELEVSSIQTTNVTVGSDPNEVLIFSGKAYVTNRNDDTVSVIDLTSNTVTATINVGNEPFGMVAFTSGSKDYLYVTNLFDNSISVIDLSTNTVTATLTP